MEITTYLDIWKEINDDPNSRVSITDVGQYRFYRPAPTKSSQMVDDGEFLKISKNEVREELFFSVLKSDMVELVAKAKETSYVMDGVISDVEEFLARTDIPLELESQE